MLPKSKIRLSRYLYSQTTPYPQARSWLKWGAFMTAVVLGFGIYLFARPTGEKSPKPILPSGEQVKQILGEQEIQYTTYEIKKGDTLFNLSQRYGISWQTLAEINSLKEPYILRIGQKIRVPAGK
ncbi:MAG: LysM peptidoglycan-binding domain-containing protein [Candidatus Doudnabacteria bacterium]|nr:LysM peptidoglycan-binding domain-containing protein [bacterium]MDZ4243884.1 LysM peptidoglycan-binding domain-containing protein [Candidatus Doudnabacteria bacterium]